MPNWIWVRDDTTGVHYDVEERALRAGMTPVPGYPANSGPGARPRQAKPFVDKAGQPATPVPAADSDEPDNNTAATPADDIEEQQ
jgi:hypothetical protein